MSGPKKVLIVSYYWPPAGGPGSIRVVKFARYLPRWGWKPVILTVQKGEFPYNDPGLADDLSTDLNIYRVKTLDPFAIYKNFSGKKADEALPVGLLTHQNTNNKEKLAAWIRALFFIPDARVGWVPFAVQKGLKIIHDEKINLVFTSSPPHSLQLIGLILKEKTKLPWIADLRDPWTDIRFYQYIRRPFCTEKIDQFFEKKVLNSADHLITVSPSLASQFREKGRMQEDSKISVLPNGFDEADYVNLSIKKTSKFQIIHAGNLLDHQNPDVLWQSLQRLSQEIPDFKKELKIRFIGRIHKTVAETLQQFGLTDNVEVQPFMPHRLLLQEILNAAVLLVVIPNVENNKGIVTGKLFEYIGSGRPILVIGPPNGDAADIVTRISNSAISDYADIDCCTEIIKTMYNAWSKNIIQKSDLERKLFSRCYLTEKLSKIFNQYVL